MQRTRTCIGRRGILWLNFMTATTQLTTRPVPVNVVVLYQDHTLMQAPEKYFNFSGTFNFWILLLFTTGEFE